MPDEDFERHEVTYQEARAVLEAQRETISDVDTKAVRTVRITVVLVGVVLSAWKLEFGLFDPVFGTLSATAFVGSIASGLFTYSEADLYLGPSKKYVEQLADGDFEKRPWREDLLYTLGTWIAENKEEIRFYGRMLFVTKSLLLLGIVSLCVAVLL